MNYFSLLLLSFLMLTFVNGCSSTSVWVRPTAEEMEAVRSLRKTIAVMPVTEDGTQFLGMGTVLEPKLISSLSRIFNVVDPLQVRQAAAAYGNGILSAAQWAEIGRKFGADYVLSGNAAVSLHGPVVQYTVPNITERGFSASVWSETTARTDFRIRMFSTKTSAVVYADKYWATRTRRSDEVNFGNMFEYRRAIDAGKVMRQIGNGVNMIASLNRSHIELIEESIDSMLTLVPEELNIYIVQSGEVLKIVSDTEILVNLGSAYNIQVGQTLTVWREGESMRDPKTGLVIYTKDKIGAVEVDRVTSGLSCVAKGKKKIIRQMQVGDKVYMK